MLDGVEQVEVVIFQLAQLQEVQTGAGPLLQQQIHRNIAYCGLYNHGHGGTGKVVYLFDNSNVEPSNSVRVHCNSCDGQL